MNIRKLVSKKSKAILLFALAVTFFAVVVWPAFSRPTPPGGDASIYIIDAAEALKSHRLTPTVESLTVYGRAPYESPLPVAGLSLLAHLTGLPLAYPLFSIYQGFFLLLILLFGGYLASRLGGVAGFVPFGLALSYGFLFLINSATLSNFAAFVIILGYATLIARELTIGRFLLGTALAAGLLMETHRSLSFLVFALVVIVIAPTIVYQERGRLRDLIRRYPLPSLGGIALLIPLAIYGLRWPVALVAYNLNQPVFWTPGPFRTAPQLADFLGTFGGVIVVALAVLGGTTLLGKRGWGRVTLFMVAWILICLLLSLLPYAGVYFYAGRFIYEAAPFMMVFAAVGLSRLWREQRLMPIAVLAVLALVVWAAPQALTTGRYLATSSNTVSGSDMTGFAAVKKNVGPSQIILANYSLSAPYRMGMIERPTIERNLSTGESFLVNPTDRPVDYLMITKPDWVGSEADLDCISEVVAVSPGIEPVYSNETVQLFHLKSQEIFVRGDATIAECLPQPSLKITDPAAYQGTLIEQNQASQVLKRGGSIELRLRIQNTGTAIWRRGSTHLVATEPLGRIPPFIREDTVAHRPSGWASASRVQMVETKIEPGQTATFVFYVSASSGQPLGTYREVYALKVDALRTLSSESAAWQITVNE